MANFKMVIQYDGTDFAGFQSQRKMANRTVQETLEDTLSTIFNEQIAINGAGRTDSGVHALGQVANFYVDTKIPCYNIAKALSVRLPSDVSVVQLDRVRDDFHARKSAIGKHYRYIVLNDVYPHALGSRYFHQSTYKLDEDKVREACKVLSGVHNYKAFCASGSNVKNFERNIYDITLRRKDKWWIFDFYGEGFMRNMVRIMVGTMLEIAQGRIGVENILKAYESGERTLLGRTAQAKGLYLVKVFYKNNNIYLDK